MARKNVALHLVISVLLLLSIVLSACGTSPTSTPVPPTAVPTAVPPQPTAVPTVAPAPTPQAPTVANNLGYVGKYPQQYELAEFKALTGHELEYTQNPYFDEMVESGELPPVAERLPEDVLVTAPYTEIGTYGGTLNGMSYQLGSGTTDIITWRLAMLVRYSDDLKTIVPDVAKDYEWNADQTVLTIHLRKGHKWSDGHPFTADDILFWWEDIIMNDDYTPVKLAVWYFDGELPTWEKIDDLTVKVTFAAPAGRILPYLATSSRQVWAPKHVVEQYHIKYNPNANTLAKATGFTDWVQLLSGHWHMWPDSMNDPNTPQLDAWILREAPTTERRVYVPNPYYHRIDTAGQQLPYIDMVSETFNTSMEVINLKIINGEIDLKRQGMRLQDYPVLKENEEAGDYTIQLVPGNSGEIYVFNRTHTDPVLREIFTDVGWNQAMSLAMNREEINELCYLGLGQPSQASMDYNTRYVEDWMKTYYAEYNPTEANRLLDEMGLQKGADGWRLRPDGKPLKILINYSSQKGSELLHGLTRSYWQAVGVQVDIKEIAQKDWQNLAYQNTLDVAVSTFNMTELGILTSPHKLYPPFGTQLDPLTGVPWRDWWDTNGEQGEEPPDVWKVQRKVILEDWPKTAVGSPEYLAIGKQVLTTLYENMIMIGTVMQVPGPTIVSNRLGNVPVWTSTLFHMANPYRVWQYYYKTP